MRRAFPCLVLFAGPSLLAQDAASRPQARTTTDAGEVLAQLCSTKSAVLAWGGHNAAVGGLRALLPDVEAALARLAATPDAEHRGLVAGALLDALVRLDARPDAVRLAAWMESHPAAVLILAGRRAKECVPLLLQLAGRDGEHVVFQAACNLLLDAAPRELAAAIAARLSVRVQLTVVDGSFGSAAGSSRSIGHGRLPGGYPPRVTYELVTEPERGDVPLGPGPTPVHWRRETHGTSWGERSVSLHATRRAVLRSEYFLACSAQLLGVAPSDLTLRAEVDLRHLWRDAASFHEAAGRALGDARGEWCALFARLVASGHLAADAVPAEPRVELAVIDRRRDRSQPLPEHRAGGR